MDPNYPNPYPPYTYPHAHAHASPPSPSPDSYPPPPSAPDPIPIPQSHHHHHHHHHHHPSPSLDSAPQQSHPYPPHPPPYLQSSNSLPHHHHHHPSFHPQQFHSFQYPPPPQHNNNNNYYYNPYPLSPQTHYPPQQHYYNPSDHLAQINLSAADHDNGSSHNRNPTPTHTLTPLYRTQSHSFSSSSHGTLIPCSAPPPALPIVPYGGGGSLKVLLLHGNLDIWVCEARYLPNLDMFSKRLGDVLGKRLSSVGKLEAMTSDPYVSILVGGASVARTYVVSNNEHPVWMQHFNVPVAHHSAEIEFVIKDNDIVGSQLIGTVDILAEHIYSGRRVEGIYPVLGTNGKPCRLGASLRISMQYVPIERMTTYLQGVGGGPEYEGVVGTYFPLRKGGRVTLYQDAHVPDGFLPDLRLEGDRHYEHGKCWVDMLEAMSQAKRLIYITGWSVFHTVQLVRDAGSGKGVTLGELLKSKSQERVRVLLLVWDDPTSRSILGYKMNGIMGTQDEETRRFFKGTSVQVLLCPRSAGKKHSWAKQQETGVIFTHHQKTVVVDADAGNSRRKLIAFVGGLDLCGGRYDTPRHPLFRTLKTLHKEDYHQPNFNGPIINGPREPWHDLHTRIDGPAAYDVLKNFEERWAKAAKRHGIRKAKKSYDDALLPIELMPELLGMHESPYQNDTDPETWHVQIFRSIDSNSVKGFPKDPKIATSKNLACGKNVLIDMSIHTAYVKAVRSAQHFLYIENQYFLGSSYNWNSNKDLGANNLIPMEIALKIASKIKANERFSAYVIVPMWPEGAPTGAATQRILYWQKKTMQMMYETIYKALKEEGLEETYQPQDYLNFFCLGNRELVGSEDATTDTGPPNSPVGLAQKNRRFMIYVHSKGIIVDDEYLIVGSANINQRSMEGTRDTEIAMGAYQPEHTWARKVAGPCGQIYGYRMSLWAEHIGFLEECFVRPESLDCMIRVRELGEINWRQFAAEEVSDMRGHLLKYPVHVDKRGKVTPLPGCSSFLDLGGNICGSFLGPQENLTI